MHCDLDPSPRSRVPALHRIAKSRHVTAALCALALCACQLDTSVPAPDVVRGFNPLPGSPWPDAGKPIWTAPTADAGTAPEVDAGTKPVDAGVRPAADAGKDAGKVTVGGSNGLGVDAGTPVDPVDAGDHHPPDAGRCGMCPSDRPHCLENATCAQCAVDGDCAQPTPRCEPTAHSCVSCLTPSDCGADMPACDLANHTCVRCTSESGCGGDSPICDVANHACVGCLSDANCAGATPHCDGNAHRCVACAQDGDCTDPALAQCAAGVCSPCTDSAQCAHLPTTHVCGVSGDSDGSGNAGHCMECATHADCTDLTRPECSKNQCSACTSDDACKDRPNAGVCDDGEKRRGRRGGDDGTGACVECNAQHEDACGGRTCDEKQKRCSDRERKSAALCAPCLSDSECDSDRVCASAEAADATAYCVIESNVDSCLASCARGLPLACALGL